MEGPTKLIHHLKALARKRGRLLDVLVFVSSLVVTTTLTGYIRENAAPFRPMIDRVSAPVAWLFLASFAAHALGAFLKRQPMHARWQHMKGGIVRRRTKGWRRRKKLSSSDETRDENESTELLLWPFENPFGGWFILLVLHWLVFSMLFASGLRGMGKFPYKLSESWARALALATFALSALPTAMVIFSLNPPRKVAVGSWRASRTMERLADLLLYFSILVTTLIWSTQFLPEPRLVYKWDLPNFLLSIVLMVPEMFIFAVFYVSPRLIYLAEDYRNPRTYLWMALAMLPVARIIFFGIEPTW